MNEFLHVLTDNWDVIGSHFWTTIQIFLIAAVGSLVIGTLLTAMRVSPVPTLRGFGTSYVLLLRNCPLTLVFALLVFAAPKLGLNIDYFPTACVALIAYTSAFVCEALRSGINTVPVGQAEAARALGMTFAQVLGLIVLPQAFRTVVPPMINVFNAMLKNTTVAAGFSVAEAGAIQFYLSERGENQIYVLLWITIGFLILVVPLIALQRTLERRWKVAR
ncbi:amino acid ABC transporter permease [Dactylosporangium sp. CA-233914]|uniref:amino acid ABC transporter permease n=1 Tax=Dactylosporangium sp. CA-233914 TaxID=3239934 RepID=UPI003D8D0A2B